MSLLINPVPLGQNLLIYDFPFDMSTITTISSIHFNAHPLLISKYGALWQTRTPVYDIDKISLFVNNVEVENTINFTRDETYYRTPENINEIHSFPINLSYRNYPYPNSCFLRVLFWRTPISTFWISCV
jgi:hypothetical protein